VFLAVALALSGWAVNRSQAVEANLTRSEAQRLAAQAITLIQVGQFPETAALLSLRSLNTLYTPEGETALFQAATLQVPVRQFEQPPNDGPLNAAFSPDGR